MLCGFESGVRVVIEVRVVKVICFEDYYPKIATRHLNFSLFTLHSSLKHALRWHMTLTTLTPINSFNYHN